MIAQLESARADLVLKRNEMERKIALFKERQKERNKESKSQDEEHKP